MGLVFGFLGAGIVSQIRHNDRARVHNGRSRACILDWFESVWIVAFHSLVISHESIADLSNPLDP